MRIGKWMERNTSSLVGKTVAVTGSTGGIGRALCRRLAELGASLILMDRNQTRSAELEAELCSEFGVRVERIRVDLEDVSSVIAAGERLSELPVDVFIHNAGAYDIPRHKTALGYDNVYQINFISPYYLIKRILPTLRERRGRAVIVSSIAHNYGKTDLHDVDYSNRRAASKVYGNAKRHLTFSLDVLFEGEGEASLAVTHPGISFTGITNHYPKLIFAIIKYPMKILFMKPRLACLSVLRGVFEATGQMEWIGPRVLDIWGLPRKKKLNTCSKEERGDIFSVAERICREMEAKREET